MDQEILKVLRLGSGLSPYSSHKYPGTTAILTITADTLHTVWNNSIIVLVFVESQRVHI